MKKTCLAGAALWLATALCTGAMGAAASSAEVVELSFGDVFVRPVGARGLEFTPVLRAAAGRQVRVVGYVVPREQPLPGRFLLTPRPVRLSEHADGEADDLPPSTLTVLLHPSQQARVVVGPEAPVTLVGQLEVGRQDDGSGRVSWLRLRLSPEALADQPLAAAPVLP